MLQGQHPLEFSLHPSLKRRENRKYLPFVKGDTEGFTHRAFQPVTWRVLIPTASTAESPHVIFRTQSASAYQKNQKYLFHETYNI
jgi:hypothetical protein